MNSQAESILHKDYRFQIFSTFCVNIISLSHGICIGWFYTLVTVLKRSEIEYLKYNENYALMMSVLRTKTKFGLIITVSGMVGSGLFAYIMQKFGRKLSLFLLAIPNINFWLTLMFASRIQYLLNAFVCFGLTFGGLLTVIPIYIIEISDMKVRGRLGVSFIVTLYLGFLVGYVLLMVVNLWTTAVICISLTIFYMIYIYYFLMESPAYYLQKESYDEAEKAMEYFANYKEKMLDERLKFELESGELEKILKFEKASKKSFLNEYVTLHTCKSIGIGISMIALDAITGIFGIFYYSYLLFNYGIKIYPSHLCILCVALAQFAGALIAFIIIDQYNRKSLLKLSIIGMYLGLSISGFAEYFSRFNFINNYNIVFIFAICFNILCANIGVATVGIIVLHETLISKIRVSITVICVSILFCSSFGIINYAPEFLNNFKAPGVCWILSFNCIIGFSAIHYFIPETYNKILLNW